MGSIIGEKIVARMLNRRGRRINLPQPLDAGELGWCLDTKQLFVGLDPENALPAIETYIGPSTMADANTILNTQIIEFTTPYLRLKTNHPNIYSKNNSEEDVLAVLANVPVSSFVLGNNGGTSSTLESNIDVMNEIRLQIAQVMSGIGNYPYTYVYDWVSSEPITAEATPIIGGGTGATLTLTVDGGGAILTAVPLATGSGYAINDVILIVGGNSAGRYTVNTIGGGGSIATGTLSAPGSTYSAGVANTIHGKLSTYTLDVAGLGYKCPPTISVTGDGFGATASAVLDTDGSGKVISLSIDTVGVGYTTMAFSFTAPHDGLGATLNVTASSGIIQTATVAAGGSGYNVGDLLYITGGDGTGRFSVLTVGVTGNVLTGSLTVAGTAYVTNATNATTVYTNRSNTLYKFTYQVGVENDASDVAFGDSNLQSLITYMNHPSFVYDGVHTISRSAGVLGSNLTATFGMINNGTLSNPGSGYANGTYVAATTGGTGTGATLTITVSGGIIQSAIISNHGSGYLGGDILTISGTGTLGAYTVAAPSWSASVSGLSDMFSKYQQFVGGLLYMPSVRQAANVAGLINKMADSTTNGLVCTKQNVEIMTELSSSTVLGDELIVDALSYQLIPNGTTTYDPIYNDMASPYNSADLTYDCAVADVQIIEYSLATIDNNLIRVGKINVCTLDDLGFTVSIEDDYTENRAGAIPAVSLGGPDFDFSATYSNMTQLVTMKYRHNFATYVILRITTRRWDSFS